MASPNEPFEGNHDGDVEMPAVTSGIARTDKKRASHQIRVEGVKYEVQVTNSDTKEKTTKTIINASATIAPNSVTAIMGSTGAGKTSLLNLLANRIHPTQGDILINGHSYKSIPMKRRLGYVMQHDKLLDTATVRESLDFAARLQLPDLDPNEREERVDIILQELGLTAISDSLVGGNMGAGHRGISGGERKRVAIGLVLITDPDILLLDEPTTGLDSFTAEAVCDTLKDLAAHGRTIICTIHQPSSDTFKKFDNLLLLSAGRVVYNGDAAKSVEYMGTQGFSCDKYTNPPDYYMQVLRTGGTSLKLRDVTTEGADISKVLADAWEAQDHGNWGERNVDLPLAPGDKKQYSGYAAGCGTQVVALAQRSMKNIMRNPMLSRARVVQSVVLGLVIGAIFFNLSDDKDGVAAKRGGLFFVTINQSMLPLMGTLHAFPSELGLVLREQQASLYSMPAYFGAKTFIEMPFLLFFPFLFTCIFYFMMDLRDSAEGFFGCSLILILTSLVAQSYGLLISSASPTVEIAQLLGPLIFLPFMLVAGFLITDIPYWLEWLHNVAFMKWSFEGLAVNEFEGRALECNPATETCFGGGGDAVLVDLHVENADYWVSVAVLAGNFCVIRILTLIVLTVKAKLVGGVQE